jgi:hypothetical protein
LIERCALDWHGAPVHLDEIETWLAVETFLRESEIGDHANVGETVME